MWKRLKNLWRISAVEVDPQPSKTFTERYRAKLSKKRATIIDMSEQPVFDLKRQEL